MSINILTTDTPETLMGYLLDSQYHTQEKAKELEPVVEDMFKRIEIGDFENNPEIVKDFLEISDMLAREFGLPSAVKNYKAHKNSSNWKGLDSADMKFDMKGFHPDLQAKIVEDVQKMSGSDKVQDEKDGKLVGIKVSDSTAKGRLARELALSTGPAATKAAEEIAASGFLSIPKELVTEVGWAALKDTWDSYQKKILAQKTPEDMGKTFCEETLFFPLELATKALNKLDTWIIAKAKESKAAREAGKSPKGEKAAPDPSTSTRKEKGTKDIPLAEFLAQKSRLEQQVRFASDLLHILNRDGRHGNALRADLADKLEVAFKEGYKNPEQLKEKYPELHKQLYEELPYLIADPRNKEFAELISVMDAIPKETRAMFAEQAECIADGLTPDGKAIIDEKTLNIPKVEESDKIKKIEQEQNGQQAVAYVKEGEENPLFTEITSVDEKTGDKTVVTKFGDVEMKRVYGKDAEQPGFYSIACKGNMILLDEFEHMLNPNAPGAIATKYNGHIADAHVMPPETLEVFASVIRPLAEQVDSYKKSLQKQADKQIEPSTKEETHETGTKDAPKTKLGSEETLTDPVPPAAPKDASKTKPENAETLVDPVPPETPKDAPKTKLGSEETLTDPVPPATPENSESQPITGPERFETVADNAQKKIDGLIATGERPEGTFASLYKKSDKSCFGIMVDPATRSLTRFHTHDGKVDSVSFFPQDNKIIIIDHNPNGRGKNKWKEKKTVYDFSKTPPSKIVDKGKPQATSGKLADTWRSLLESETKLFDAVCKTGAENYSNLNSKLNENATTGRWHSLNDFISKGRS